MNDDAVRHPAGFDDEWADSVFTDSIPVVRGGETVLDDDWEARFNEDTTGYVSDPLTTSFTDMDLGPAILKLGETSGLAGFEAWLDD
jgi:hypothetical protein